jgi:hypothetical protein
MKRLDILFNLLSYEGSQTNDPADAIKVKNRIEVSDISASQRVQLVLADNTIDQAIILPEIPVDYLAILVDRQITVKLNGSDDALTLTPKANGAKTLVFFQKGVVSTVSITNESGAAVSVDLIAISN